MTTDKNTDLTEDVTSMLPDENIADSAEVAAKPAKKAKAAAAAPIDENKRKAMDLALAQIEKNFGKGSIMKLGQNSKMQVETTPTGSISLDIALGGGIPKGRIIEVYGPESSGKTTLTLHAIAEVQKAGGQAAFIDAEHALDPEYASKIGVNLDELLVSQPDSGEQALEIVETLVRSNAVDLIVVDSVAALTPRAEIEGEMGDSHMGLQARLMSQALRKLTAAVSRSNVTIIFINQIRMKIGVMFGNPETTTGGNALKFYASVRMEIRSSGKIEGNTADGKELVGNRVKVKIVKNKVAPPFKVAEFDIMFNKGISAEGDILDLSEKFNITRKSGAFYSYKDENIGQGRENAKTYLRNNPAVMKEIADAVFVASKDATE
jgi:recombination protein RecA